jgi:Family of unknown function (DUF6527)
MSEIVQGRRGVDGDWTSDRQPGEYWRNENGWWALTPRFEHAVDLSTWQVTDHEDGTITVAPSIFVNQGAPNAWHGFLECGMWREV